jgi:hypothetical protein
MHESELIESTISEYKSLVYTHSRRPFHRMGKDRLIRSLCRDHSWTDNGARAIVSLANDYGAFMLRNALALSIALDKEDGDLQF